MPNEICTNDPTATTDLNRWDINPSDTETVYSENEETKVPSPTPESSQVFYPPSQFEIAGPRRARLKGLSRGHESQPQSKTKIGKNVTYMEGCKSSGKNKRLRPFTFSDRVDPRSPTKVGLGPNKESVLMDPQSKKVHSITDQGILEDTETNSVEKLLILWASRLELESLTLRENSADLLDAVQNTNRIVQKLQAEFLNAASKDGESSKRLAAMIKENFARVSSKIDTLTNDSGGGISADFMTTILQLFSTDLKTELREVSGGDGILSSLPKAMDNHLNAKLNTLDQVLKASEVASRAIQSTCLEVAKSDAYGRTQFSALGKTLDLLVSKISLLESKVAKSDTQATLICGRFNSVDATLSRLSSLIEKNSLSRSTGSLRPILKPVPTSLGPPNNAEELSGPNIQGNRSGTLPREYHMSTPRNTQSQSQSQMPKPSILPCVSVSYSQPNGLARPIGDSTSLYSWPRALSTKEYPDKIGRKKDVVDPIDNLLESTNIKPRRSITRAPTLHRTKKRRLLSDDD
ncbi:hypothetical protein BABINDRAFT_182735 [Babjeviella inositovora NRRL Y-12698]|uniref:Uncharacterized protein n=1 Tax=Babjeviella inositovora NRRL Y-12698 TaxID=984486 RepID=A0A1E3QVI9_9ASCO|nr:uncharacterized protein BABINDRAFT_182735 [Babjeviella inositovora NRRL Y-12698]ODQ81634.1 hypothetical protein BABINDRAFT_182735 [Babjeviella inositovora NRRL Y-12698]